MKHTLLRCIAALVLVVSSSALAQGAPPTDKKAVPEAPKPVEKERKPAEPEKPKEQAVTCTLLTKEAPRGGRLEVEGQKLGKSPVVKIGGVVTRIIERPGDKIAVQIPRKSDGGEVIVVVDAKNIACGTLTIIGLD
jgi:hypothetical protein